MNRHDVDWFVVVGWILFWLAGAALLYGLLRLAGWVMS